MWVAQERAALARCISSRMSFEVDAPYLCYMIVLWVLVLTIARHLPLLPLNEMPVATSLVPQDIRRKKDHNAEAVLHGLH